MIITEDEYSLIIVNIQINNDEQEEDNQKVHLQKKKRNTSNS